MQPDYRIFIKDLSQKRGARVGPGGNCCFAAVGRSSHSDCRRGLAAASSDRSSRSSTAQQKRRSHIRMAAAADNEAANNHIDGTCTKKTEPATKNGTRLRRVPSDPLAAEHLRTHEELVPRPKLPPGSRSQSFGSGCMSNSITAPF